MAVRAKLSFEVSRRGLAGNGSDGLALSVELLPTLLRMSEDFAAMVGFKLVWVKTRLVNIIHVVLKLLSFSCEFGRYQGMALIFFDDLEPLRFLK